LPAVPARERDVASIGQGPIALKLAMRGLRSRNTDMAGNAEFT
jgi:hypothetical protein